MNFRGKTIAVDMPCWIHRGAIADAQNICLGRDTGAILKFVTKGLIAFIQIGDQTFPPKLPTEISFRRSPKRNEPIIARLMRHEFLFRRAGRLSQFLSSEGARLHVQ